MFCIKCLNPTTQVNNSRPNKKTPSIWRRRTCTRCHSTFTTYETPSLADCKPILLPDGTTTTFSLSRLAVSISGAFSHDVHKAKYDCLPLAQTVEAKLITSQLVISTDIIAQTTYETLRRFDELAAIQYAAKHHLITNVRRRGRPSLSSPHP